MHLGPRQCHASVCMGVPKGVGVCFICSRGQPRHRQVLLPTCPMDLDQAKAQADNATYMPLALLLALQPRQQQLIRCPCTCIAHGSARPVPTLQPRHKLIYSQCTCMSHSNVYPSVCLGIQKGGTLAILFVHLASPDTGRFPCLRVQWTLTKPRHRQTKLPICPWPCC